MYCKSCGKQIDDDSTYCSFCGTKQTSGFKPEARPDKSIYVGENLQHQVDGSASTNKNNYSHKYESQQKYDPAYKKDDDAMTAGVTLLIFSIIIALVGPSQFELTESYERYRAIISIISLIIRTFITFWVVNIAKEQNRESFTWGVFAFITPSIALIVIATKQKLFQKVEIIHGLANDQNSKILMEKAKEFYRSNKYSESLRFAERALQLNPEEINAKEMLKKSKIALSELNNINNGIKQLLIELDGGDLLKIIFRGEVIIGAKAFLNDGEAPNGIYYTKGENQKIIIDNGKVTGRYFIDRIKDLVIEKSGEFHAKQGDKVFLKDGTPAPTGKYNLGFMMSKLIVDDGRISKYQ